mmetsp:Transcript_7266/g.6784  ORF Transcript_7266/g.6784 Transcript_7266/m.6784 type:complete len:222 (-) Transcript_7266:13-678(-)
MSIAMYGNEEIFPTDTRTESGLVYGLSLEYYLPTKRNFIDKMFVLTGIPFFLMTLLGLVLYIFFCFTHKNVAFLKRFRGCALVSSPLRVKSRTLDNTLTYEPKSYNHQTIEKYSEAFEIVRYKLSDEGRKDPKKQNNITISFQVDHNGTDRKLVSQSDIRQQPLYFDTEVGDKIRETPPIQEEDDEEDEIEKLDNLDDELQEISEVNDIEDIKDLEEVIKL